MVCFSSLCLVLSRLIAFPTHAHHTPARTKVCHITNQTSLETRAHAYTYRPNPYLWRRSDATGGYASPPLRGYASPPLPSPSLPPASHWPFGELPVGVSALHFVRPLAAACEYTLCVCAYVYTCVRAMSAFVLNIFWLACMWCVCVCVCVCVRARARVCECVCVCALVRYFLQVGPTVDCLQQTHIHNEFKGIQPWVKIILEICSYWEKFDFHGLPPHKGRLNATTKFEL